MRAAQSETMRLVSRRYNWLMNSRLTKLELAAQTRTTAHNRLLDFDQSICQDQLIGCDSSQPESSEMTCLSNVEDFARNHISPHLQVECAHSTSRCQLASSTRTQTSINQWPRAHATRQFAGPARVALVAFVCLMALALSVGQQTVGVVAATKLDNKLAQAAQEHQQQHAQVAGDKREHESEQIQRTADNPGHLDEQPPQPQRFRKRSNSPLDHINSADLPSEFRGAAADEESKQPKEQSTLAKLCQQTSSVLASVLPAPFGGHKRSILCQFFGQVHVPSNNNNKRQPNQIKSSPYALPGLQKLPTGAHVRGEPESIAILQQHRQPPISLLATGKHPIQLVLEHQQRQQQQQQHLQSQQQRLVSFGPMPSVLFAPDQASKLQQGADSINPTFRARLEPPESLLKQRFARPSQRPKQQVKFSAPLATSAQPPSNPTTSTSDVASSGWRIYNASVESSSPGPSSSWSSPMLVAGESENTASSPEMTTVDTFEVVKDLPPTKASTPTAYELKISDLQMEMASKRGAQSGPEEAVVVDQSNATTAGNKEARPTPKPQPTYQRPKTVVVVAGEQSRQQTSSQQLGKRTSETLKSTTKAVDLTADSSNNSSHQETAIRTIEVSAQTNANLTGAPELLMTSSSVQNAVKLGQPKLQIINLSQQRLESGQADLTNKSAAGVDSNKQVQKREELVIASINNLTRIAFGNQLRDTVKVINKLIDQQADIFSTSAGSSKKASAAPANLDPMLASDSVERHQVVSVNAVIGKEKNPDEKSSNKKSKSSNNNKTTLTFTGSTTVANKSTSRPTSTTGPTDDAGRLKVNKRAKAKQLASTSTIAPRTSQRKPSSTTTKFNKDYTIDKKKPTTKPQRQVVKNDVRETTSTFGRIVAPYKPTRLSSSSSSRAVGSSNGRNYELAGLTGRESRRLTTLGRSVSSSSGGQTTRPSSTTRAAKFAGHSPSEELQLAETVNDISRDHKQRHQTAPRVSPSTRQPARLASSDLRHQPTSQTSNVVTQFPWLLPEKNIFNSDLFASSSVQDARNPVGPVQVDLASKKWTTRKSESDQRSLLNKQAHPAPNRIDSTPRMTKADSLTTLKMSLQTSTSRSPVSSSTTTRLPFSTGTQSRWVPSTMFATRPASKSTTTTTTTTTTTSPIQSSSASTQSRSSPIQTTTSTTANSSPTTVKMQTSPSPAPTTVTLTTRQASSSSSGPKLTTSLTLSEFNEARASDSISKYTTHLNEANELLAATTRRHLYAQPLPQIAQTGEYFSAETIASWPERYQTMMSKALEEQTGMSSTKAMETTRRNGESYDYPSAASSSTTAAMARHRIDTTQQTHAEASRTTQQLSTSGGLATSSLGPGVTILPANHKLASSGPLTTTTRWSESQEAGETDNDDDNSGEQDDDNDSDTTNSMLAATTMMIQQATETPPTPAKELGGSMGTATTINKYQERQQQQREQPLASSYTFAIPNNQQQQTTLADGIGGFSSPPFPRVLGDLLMGPSDNHDQNGETAKQLANTANFQMKPPYHQGASSETSREQLVIESLAGSTPPDESSLVESRQKRPQVSKKLYEMLVPSALRAQNQSAAPLNNSTHHLPISPHRFNLSALKYLAQTLLNPSGGRPANESSQSVQYPPFEGNATNTMTSTTMTMNEATSPQRLIDLLSGNIQGSTSANYYDLLLNDTNFSPMTTTTTTTLSEPQDNGDQNDNQNSTTGRQTIFGRAGNLFNDLKQLEQRRAAAILAAIRYQVPSPLVKPWDVNSDLWIGQQPQSMLSRLDDYLATNSNSSQAGLFVSQLGKAIKSSRLFKQRLVPRHELEARLNGSSRGSLLASFVGDASQRRSDPFPAHEQPSGQLSADGASLDHLRNMLSANDSSSANEASLLEKLLSSTKVGRQNDSDEHETRDFELIGLSNKNNHTVASKEKQSQVGPKYASFLNQQKSDSTLASEPRKWKFGASSVSSSNQLAAGPSEVAARLKSAATSRHNSEKTLDPLSRKDPQQPSTNNDDHDDQVTNNANTFDCNGRASGLYPDVDSACRTFYHCSSTGHLLTFNCPSQTRFDEKSLKCGPWFEVPCNLGRANKLS